MKVNWSFVIICTICVVNFLVAVADFLQGGVMWPLLILVVGTQVLAAASVFR